MSAPTPGISSTLTTITGAAGLQTAPGSLPDADKARGICSLQTASGQTFRFRTNPNSIRWKYQLNTSIEDTYGGRVIQVLSANITQLEVQVEAGWGGWPYVVKLAYFMRDMMNEQRDGRPATFQYTTRNWKLKVFAASIPFTDTVGRPNAKIDMAFNVVEDSNGQLQSTTIGAELSRLQDGIGYQRNQYNTSTPDGTNVGDPLTALTGAAAQAASLLQNFFSSIPGATGPTSSASGSLDSLPDL